MHYFSFIYLSFFTESTFTIVVVAIFSPSALLKKPFIGWKVPKKAVTSLLEKLKKYKTQLRHTRYVSATFLDDRLKKFSNWKEIPPHFATNFATPD